MVPFLDLEQELLLGILVPSLLGRAVAGKQAQLLVMVMVMILVWEKVAQGVRSEIMVMGLRGWAATGEQKPLSALVPTLVLASRNRGGNRRALVLALVPILVSGREQEKLQVTSMLGDGSKPVWQMWSSSSSSRVIRNNWGARVSNSRMQGVNRQCRSSSGSSGSQFSSSILGLAPQRHRAGPKNSAQKSRIGTCSSIRRLFNQLGNRGSHSNRVRFCSRARSSSRGS